jgi:short-subunit dehydrogenase
MNIVITGSTKGIGLGLAAEFVAQGHNVVISSRQAAAVEAALAQLRQIGAGNVEGYVADVSKIDDVQGLWAKAGTEFRFVDIWVNNAGITNRRLLLAELPAEQIESVVSTNLIGLMNGAKVAVEGMLAQDGGKIFNMEGFGGDGLLADGMSVYGTTKRGVRYFTKSIAREYRASPLVIGLVNPGVVITELLTKDLYEPESVAFEKRKRFLNIVSDRVETVAPILAKAMLNLEKTGKSIQAVTAWQILGRFLRSPFVKRDVFHVAE